MTETAKIGAPIHPATSTVQELWIRDQSVSAAEIHRRISRLPNLPTISARKVQDIVRKMKSRNKSVDGPRFTYTAWQRWTDPPVSSEDLDFLLGLKFVKKVCFGGEFLEHEARMAVQIRAAVSDLNPILQFVIVQEYAYREEIRLVMGEDVPKTQDLDDLLVLKPWRPENAEIWEKARMLGFGPKPGFFFGRAPQGYNDEPDKLDPHFWIRDSLTPSDETKEWVNGRTLEWRELVDIGLSELLFVFESMGRPYPRDSYPEIRHRVPEEYEAQLHRYGDGESIQ